MISSKRALLKVRRGTARRQRALLPIERRSQTDAHIEARIVEHESPPTKVPIFQTFLAWAAGVGTLSALSATVELATAHSCPPFDPHGQRFDQSHFWGRLCRMVIMCDPYLLLYSSEEVERRRKQLVNFADDNQKTDPTTSHRDLWEAKRIYEAAMNNPNPFADDAELVPRPFRMNGFVSFNIPISVSMIAAESTLPLLFWAWMNQSQNAMVNYFNRNPSSHMSQSTMLKSYTVAVTSALTVALGLATVIQRRYPPVQAKALLKWVTFPSAVVAGSLNCYIVRSPELESGISIQDANGDTVLPDETSQIAAAKGVNTTTFTRALLQFPYLVSPAVLSNQRMIIYLARHPTMTIPVTTYLIITTFGVGLPISIAVFPQMSEIPTQALEEKYHQIINPETGHPYDVLYYNKGL